MAIDWFTTGAQIINFLILIWLLKKLLFKPIIGAMESREQGLANRLQQAETKMAEAQSLKNQYGDNIQQLNREKDQILTQTKQQATAEKAQVLQRLNEEGQQKKTQFDAEIHKQQQDLAPLMSRTIAEKSLLLSRKTLARLADKSLEKQIIEHFLQHLSRLPDKEQASFKQALQKEKSATMITAFKMDIQSQKKIQTWFDNFQPESKLVFEQQDYLLSGIALEADGRSWEWNIDRYLTELGTELL